MNRWLRAFCWCVLQLDRIPSYRRTYVVNIKTRTHGPAEWKFRWRGDWGIYLLIRMKLLNRYLDYFEEHP
jgi:hypothetical protein